MSVKHASGDVSEEEAEVNRRKGCPGFQVAETSLDLSKGHMSPVSFTTDDYRNDQTAEI